MNNLWFSSASVRRMQRGGRCVASVWRQWQRPRSQQWQRSGTCATCRGHWRRRRAGGCHRSQRCARAVTGTTPPPSVRAPTRRPRHAAADQVGIASARRSIGTECDWLRFNRIFVLFRGGDGEGLGNAAGASAASGAGPRLARGYADGASLPRGAHHPAPPPAPPLHAHLPHHAHVAKQVAVVGPHHHHHPGMLLGVSFVSVH